jgi:hypothetical protein
MLVSADSKPPASMVAVVGITICAIDTTVTPELVTDVSTGMLKLAMAFSVD